MTVESYNTDNGAVVAWCVNGVRKWLLLGKWCSGDRGGPGGSGGVSCVTVVATNCNGSNGIKLKEREREREREREKRRRKRNSRNWFLFFENKKHFPPLLSNFLKFKN